MKAIKGSVNDSLCLYFRLTLSVETIRKIDDIYRGMNEDFGESILLNPENEIILEKVPKNWTHKFDGNILGLTFLNDDINVVLIKQHPLFEQAQKAFLEAFEFMESAKDL